MHAFYCICTLVLLVSCAKKTQDVVEKPINKPLVSSIQTFEVYDVYLGFHSIGTGTFSDKPLQDFLIHFENAQSVNITKIDRIGPLGREGEYALGFILQDFTENQKKLFVQELKQIPWNSNKGSVESHISIIENQKISEINKPSIAETAEYQFK